MKDSKKLEINELYWCTNDGENGLPKLGIAKIVLIRDNDFKHNDSRNHSWKSIDVRISGLFPTDDWDCIVEIIRDFSEYEEIPDPNYSKRAINSKRAKMNKLTNKDRIKHFVAPIYGI